MIEIVDAIHILDFLAIEVIKKPLNNVSSVITPIRIKERMTGISTILFE
jgi:hypothetical protein